MTSNKTQLERLAVIETKLDAVQSDLNTIKTNHLAHIYDRLEELQTFRTQVLTLAGLGGMIGSAIIQIVLKFVN